MTRTLASAFGRTVVDRSTGGVLRVRAKEPLGRAYGLGWGHAADRILQMVVLRAAARGEAAERLAGTDAMVAQDRYLRSKAVGWAALRQTPTLGADAAALAEAYAAGVNRWLTDRPRPLELRALGLDVEPWRPIDSVLVALFQSYLGLAQSQEVVERFIARVGAHGTPSDHATLRDLFAPHLRGFDPALLAGVPLDAEALRVDPLCAAAFRAPMSSNAIAVPPRRSASGHALVAGDPHLDTTQVPAAFHEAILLGPHTIQAGITVPGVPGVLAGRFTQVALAITYGFLDQLDFFVEQVQSGRVLRGSDWVPLERRDERIRRRDGGADSVLSVWRSELGVIQGDPSGPEPRRLLALRWVLDGEGLEHAFALPFRLETARTVEEARAVVAHYPQSFQFTLADTAGNTGLQQTGRAPQRAPGHSGLHPEPGWDQSRWWNGTVPNEDLVGLTQDRDGDRVLVTANETTNAAGGRALVTLGLSRDRRDRIASILAAGPVDRTAIRAVQRDRLSLSALRLRDGLRTRLEERPGAARLLAWDGRFEPESEEATLLERVRSGLLWVIYGPLFDRADPGRSPGREVVREAHRDDADRLMVWSEANAVTTNVPAFADRLLDPTNPALQGRSWADLIDGVLEEALATPARPWRRVQRVRRSHFLWAGSPTLRRGPLGSWAAVPGASDSPEQGRIHRLGGRVATVAPVWRMYADLGEPALHTALFGGPSDRLLDPCRGPEQRRFAQHRLKRLPLD